MCRTKRVGRKSGVAAVEGDGVHAAQIHPALLLTREIVIDGEQIEAAIARFAEGEHALHADIQHRVAQLVAAPGIGGLRRDVEFNDGVFAAIGDDHAAVNQWAGRNMRLRLRRRLAQSRHWQQQHHAHPGRETAHRPLHAPECPAAPMRCASCIGLPQDLPTQLCHFRRDLLQFCQKRYGRLMSTSDPTPAPKPEAEQLPAPKPVELPKEVGGAAGPEPTRYGDWAHKGRVSDF